MPNSTSTPISDVGEFGLIDRMAQMLGAPDDDDLLVGIEDDAAVYRAGEGRVHILTTDALIESVHFDRMFTPMQNLGAKAVSVNVSDVVAMNGRPRYATVAIGVPNNFTVEAVEKLYEGMRQACEAYDLTIIGGDTTAARHLTLSVTVVGEAKETDIVERRGAQPGDVLCVTGDLGGAYAGLKVLLAQHKAMREEGESFTPDLDPHRYVIERQLSPHARLDVVADWAERGVMPHALIDISDGLASEVHHICDRSDCGALLQSAAIPIDLETRAVADQFAEEVDTYALYGGEDYELVFALPEEELEKLDPESFAVVGECTPADDGVQIRMPEGDVMPLAKAGFSHFDK